MKTDLIKALVTTVDHFFPRFNEWLDNMTDIRRQESTEYSFRTIIWTAIMALVTKRGAKSRITNEMRFNNFYKNIKELSGQEDLEKIPHGDTVEYLLMRMEVEEAEGLQGVMIQRLLRNKVFENERLFQKYHVIAIDGVHEYTFDYPHCDKCLVKEDANGNKQWSHYKSQAVMVTESKLCMPIATEWIENEESYDKQDCETKAAKRLIKKLRKQYSRLPICVLMDGLFATEPMIEALKEARMEYIIVFKEGRCSEIYNWVMSIKEICRKENIIVEKEAEEIPVRNRRTHNEKLERSKPKHKTRERVKETVYTWMSNIEYNETGRIFNVMTCKEVVDKKTKCDYVWIVSDGLNLNEDTVVKLAKTARCRWKIENEIINVQKNGGYNLEHQYSRDPVSMKIWQLIIDIAFIINQLIEKGSLISMRVYGTVRNLANRMFEQFCYFTFRKPEVRPQIQIRLCWNTS